MKKIYLISIVSFVIFFSSFNSSIAQISSSGTAITAPLVDADAQEGDILCTYEGGVKRCNQEYDPSIYAILSENTSAEFDDPEVENGRHVVSYGIAQVRVSAANGNISKGDFITSSVNPGVGGKAIRNGFVIGVSLDDYSPSNTNDIGKIQVLLNIHPVTGLSGPQGNLIQFIRKGISVPIFEPLESLRYILAVIIILISFTLGLIYFGRASRTGIEAIGRNPLAKRVIQLTVILNIVLTIVIVLVGLAIAYLILIL